MAQVLLATGASGEAETHLRGALARHAHTGTRVALARALAAQGRFAEAVTEVTTALKRHRGAWPSDQPGQAEVRAWLVEWQAHLADSQVLGGVLPSNSDALAGG